MLQMRKSHGLNGMVQHPAGLPGAASIGAVAASLRKISVGLAMCLVLSGCSYFSSGDEKAGLINPDPPEQIYSTADQLLERGDYEAAAEKFVEVDKHHPYSHYARRAMALTAYSYYLAGKYDEAISFGRRYTSMHPGTKEAALAHHVIAMSYYKQVNGPSRDQARSRKALAEFKILQRRYPESRYAKQAPNRIRIVEDLLAASEMTVGRFYLRKENYLASINRFRTVVVEFQSTAHVEEALMRLTEAYMALGIINEARTAGAVLGHNFPDSRWYKEAYALLAADGLQPYEDSSSWISKTWQSTVSVISSASPL